MLHLVHIELKQANEYILAHHRHHGRIQGHRFSLGAVVDQTVMLGINSLVGVIVVGRPVGGQHQGDWVEVTRCCTNGVHNGCSFLYGAAARAAKDLGFKRIQTYILNEETGVSLKAAGWKFERLSHPVGWHHDKSETAGRAARVVQQHLMQRKQLWYRDL